MRYVGLDVHKRTSTFCILDENGRRVKRETVKGFRDKVIARLAELPELAEPFTICFEATCGYGWLHDQLARIARRVVVAHPGQLRLIFRTKRKNDRVDATKLAKLLYLDEVPPAYVPSIAVRDWRHLIETRRRLVDQHTGCKSAIRSLLHRHGIRPVKGLWSRRGLRWLAELDWPTAGARLRCHLLLEHYEMLRRQVGVLTRELDRCGRRHPGVQLLRTIPGVGPRTAETIVAYLDDPHRFGNARQVGSYFGLVPCQDASAGRDRLGHITRQGPGTARKYLVQAAWQAVRRNATVRAYFDRIRHDRSDRKKIAIVATACWLLRCMYAMLRSGEVWRDAA